MSQNTIRLTAAQAMVRWLSAQYVVEDGEEVPYFAGCWAIFGHGNVAGLGEALHAGRAQLPTYRAHNEQAMVHAAVAYAKQKRRQRAMVCTTSIGPGATNMITAAAGAHVNRLPVLLVPGDVYASRRPDPVLQQAEDFDDGTVSFNECFRPASRYFDRLTRPEQLLDSLPRAMMTMRDPARCGPATLAFCQDVQAEAYDYPAAFFGKRIWRDIRPVPERHDVVALADALRHAKRPLIIAGGGVLYSHAEARLAAFAERYRIPVCETQAGKGALAWNHPANLGAIGVTGTSPANAYAAQADVIVGLGTRLSDFTTGSRTLFPDAQLYQVNVQPHDGYKHGAVSVHGDATRVLEHVEQELGDASAMTDHVLSCSPAVEAWNQEWSKACDAPEGDTLPSDAQVIGAVQRSVSDDAVVVCAAGGLPGELHKLWRANGPGTYHLEYGYSCMGYEIAGGLGVKLADPDREVVVMVGDGSYLMLNSEIATSVMMGAKLIITVLDNRGYGCINRLQQASGSPGFNNLLADSVHEVLPDIDFAAHAASLGAQSEKVSNIKEFEAALGRAREADRTSVIVIETDPLKTTEAGGWWWDVAVPEVSERPEVTKARQDYEAGVKMKRDLS